ncbi:hypothetical protein ACSBR2_018206 [Camellia fascicularis]
MARRKKKNPKLKLLDRDTIRNSLAVKRVSLSKKNLIRSMHRQNLYEGNAKNALQLWRHCFQQSQVRVLFKLLIFSFIFYWFGNETATYGWSVWEVPSIRVLSKIDCCMESRGHPYDNDDHSMAYSDGKTVFSSIPPALMRICLASALMFIVSRKFIPVANELMIARVIHGNVSFRQLPNGTFSTMFCRKLTTKKKQHRRAAYRGHH